MARQFTEMTDDRIRFIQNQKVYFVGTATAEGRINISPKGHDTFRILDSRRVAWLNLTGSGNESAAHVQLDPRMTIMFMAVSGDPLILRLYGSARVVHHKDDDWPGLYSRFDVLPGARQIFDVTIDMVQSSCGFAVPQYEYAGDRSLLLDVTEKRGDEGIRQYWRDKNQHTIDGFPTNIVEKNL